MDNYLIPIIPFYEQAISYGKGSYIFDSDGKKYLDLNSGQFCTILGHANPELVEKVTEISRNIVHTSSGMISEAVIRTAQKLNKISGRLNASSILLSTGAEAVEFAIRYAKHITGKEGVVCFEKGYHGLTLGTQSITFGGRYACPAVSCVFSVPIPNEEDKDNCIEKFERTVKENKSILAAAIMEPIVSVGGMLYPPAEYFAAVKDICEENNVLLIFDESQTGFGRTGSWFCFQELNVIPDMVVCSKGIGMGYPVSAVMFNGRLGEQELKMTHYSSHQNDPFAAGIVEFGINYIEENNLLESNKEKGMVFLEKLNSLCNRCECYRNARGHGMMLGLDLYIPGINDYRPIYHNMYIQAAHMGLLLQATDGERVLRFLPDYLLTYDNMDLCIEVLERVKI